MVTMNSADKALKSLYLGVVSEQLNTASNPLLSKIKQSTQDVWGKEVRRVAQYGVNGGVGAGTEDGNLPAAAGNNYDQFVLTLKNLYGTIEISDKAIRASENNVGAFVNLLNAEMEGLLKASSYNFGRMLFGDGSGKIASVTAITDCIISVDTVKGLIEGMVIDFVTTSGVVIGSASARKILYVDRVNKKIKIGGNTLTTSIVPVGCYVTVQNSYNKEIHRNE